MTLEGHPSRVERLLLTSGSSTKTEAWNFEDHRRRQVSIPPLQAVAGLRSRFLESPGG